MKLLRYGRAIERLGQRYRLDGSLGKGGMADVCLAWDEQRKREVAIKVIKSDELDQKTLDRFLKEASHIATWDHPNILRIYSDLKLELLDSAQGSIVPYIVMEYAQGGDLQRRLQLGTPYPFNEALTIFSQLCSAVAYAHKQGVIHRDLKPPNILFRVLPDGSEQTVLSDFGLAVETSATHHTFARAGTLLYMAPEQISGQAQPASDIFSLGVLLYQLCTGWLPFQRSLRDLRLSELYHTPRSPSSIERSLPAAIDDVLLRALAAEPSQRFATAALFWNAVCIAVPDALTLTKRREAGHKFPTQSQIVPQREKSSKSRPPIRRSLSVHIYSEPSSQKSNPPIISASSGIDGLGTRHAVQDMRQTPESPRLDEQQSLPDWQNGSLKQQSVQDAYKENSIARMRAVSRNLSSSARMRAVSQNLPSSPHPAFDSRPPASPEASHLPSLTSDLNADRANISGVEPRAVHARQPAYIGVKAANHYIANITLKLRQWMNRGGVISSSVILLVLVLFLTAIFLVLLNAHSASATSVTIAPASQAISDSYTITAVINNPDPVQHQIAAQQVSSGKQSLMKIVIGTGHAHGTAQQAKGQVTFLNSAMFAQTVLAGTTIQGADGVSVALDANANIPAANFNGQSGQVTVSAHAVNTGVGGNIAALDLNNFCCVADSSIFVKNFAAFTGGQDAKDYQFVQQSDVDIVAKPLVAQLSNVASGILTQRLKTNQQLAPGIQCPATVRTDNPIGDNGKSIPSLTVTIAVTCKGAIYDQKELQTMVTQLLQDKAKDTIGQNYALQGNVIIYFKSQNVNPDMSIAFQVNASGTWIYQLDNGQKHALAKLIAGRSAADANNLLKKQNGIRVVSIGNGTFAQDPNQVSIIVQNSN